MDTIQATAAFGLEAVVKRQCEAIGLGPCKIEEGHVLFPGGPEEVMRANLWLASADRVLWEVLRFPAQSFEELFDQVAAFPWADLLPMDAKFPIRAKTVKSKLASPSDVQKIVKKAIVRAMQRKYAISHFPETGPAFPVDVSIRKDECVICLDTTGEGLFKRGYREEKGGAPIKETLAAGLLDLTVWQPDRPLADVFCGSGTFLIEAARKAAHIAPGIDRHFLFESWPSFSEETFREMRREAMAGIDFSATLDLHGFDIDPKMVQIARHNAEEAGVEELVHFHTVDMREVMLKENFGVLLSNPPYGKRLETKESMERLMKDFSERFLSLRTWSVYVITPADLEAISGRKATRRRKLFNGGEQTTFYQFLGLNPRDFR